NCTISSICIFLDFSPVELIPFMPPAISTICGTQWPAENNGSSHSMHNTFGLEILDVSFMLEILFCSFRTKSLALSCLPTFSPTVIIFCNMSSRFFASKKRDCLVNLSCIWRADLAYSLSYYQVRICFFEDLLI